MKHPKTLKEARIESGRTASEVAHLAGVSRASLYRIEAGDQLPGREVARKLFELYRGQVDLLEIYDPEFAPKARSVA